MFHESNKKEKINMNSKIISKIFIAVLESDK